MELIKDDKEPDPVQTQDWDINLLINRKIGCNLILIRYVDEVRGTVMTRYIWS